MLQAQIFIDKHELMGTQALYEYILQLLIRQSINGATVFEGTVGYGINQRINHPHALFSFDETPMTIIFIDSKEKVISALTTLRKIWKGGFIVTNPVDVFNIEDNATGNNFSSK